ncbi:RNA polymerase sigma factor [Brytella acorum]|uniref:Sigma-70 family RNA polymerase sigma factor n=1 Tax=Brytella acorum TaxID=2959299 RepID=A0AA35Y1C7_9PROT|nr:sigma-70 family RNA polymerase sigma factor [Brytella acorum]CAI9120497.1 sigma-70 family RNA polymerase sigma factor [Brytella acorum]
MLYVVARNAAYDAHRHNQVVVASADTMASLYGGADQCDPERYASARETLGVVDQALSTLSPRCREIFTLRRVHGLSSTVIGNRFGISQSAVEKMWPERSAPVRTQLRTSHN